MESFSALTVSQVNFFVRSVLDSCEALQCVFVVGEIFNLNSNYQSGHVYFSLKDAKSTLRVVMFQGQAKSLKFCLENGMKVVVRGSVSVYEASGSYQLYAQDLQVEGAGALSVAFEQLKTKLAAEGLFRQDKKRALPKFPRRIGIVTSPTGAVFHDMQTILARRFPLAKIIFEPVLVQGPGAAAQISAAIAKFTPDLVDVLIVGRGGGSMEDLAAFNEEVLARAVAASSVPVVSAVGHETDFTICDFVADLRAPTPSAAAELVAPDVRTLQSELCDKMSSMCTAIFGKTKLQRLSLERILGSVCMRTPTAFIDNNRQKVDTLTASLGMNFSQRIATYREIFGRFSAMLEALSPLKLLSAGYSLTFSEGNLVRSAKDVKIGTKISVKLHGGALDCTVNATALDEQT